MWKIALAITSVNLKRKSSCASYKVRCDEISKEEEALLLVRRGDVIPVEGLIGLRGFSVLVAGTARVTCLDSTGEG